MNSLLQDRVATMLAAPVVEPVRSFAERLGRASGALGVLFYGSNLRTGELEGVLDFYVLLPGQPDNGIWPRVSYHEWDHGGQTLRAKVATMTFATFAAAAAGQTRDTTIWARFVQPSALAWVCDDAARSRIADGVAGAARTAGLLAAALGPSRAEERTFWSGLFQATYQAEFRFEKAGRGDAIIAANEAHFRGLLPGALSAVGTEPRMDGAIIEPNLPERLRSETLRRWVRWRRYGKPLNLLRLVKATTTFEGAARYAAWKIERHTGVPIRLSPWRERHPILAAPGVLFQVWRAQKRGRA